MNTKLAQAHDNFIEAMGQISSSLRLNRVVGQLYALLYLSERPLSLDDMVERLRISKGHVSTNIRELEKFGAVRKVWVKGERKDYYEADLRALKILASRFQAGLKRRLEDILSTINGVEQLIQDADKELSGEEKQMAKVYKERLKKAKRMSVIINRTLGLISKMAS